MDDASEHARLPQAYKENCAIEEELGIASTQPAANWCACMPLA